MLIYAEWKNSWLHLKAYTENKADFDDIYKAFNEADLEFSTENIEKNESGMDGKLIKVYDSNVGKLQDILGITFMFSGTETQLQFNITAGTSYKCQRINGAGCETFTSSSAGAATIRCGAIAVKKGWNRGGKASPGSC